MSESEALRIDEHLDGCSACLDAVASLRITDPLLESMLRVASDPTISIDSVDAMRVEISRSVQREIPERLEKRIGSYRIEGVLGRGGMGVVYLARHDRLRRAVALKVLPVRATSDRVNRFRREADMIAALRHPNIVQLFEIGEHEARPFFVMEYVPGGSLGEKLAAAPVHHSEAARLIEIAARAVAAAHSQGVIHRDLKPANLLLDPPGGPKVADFGLAKFRDSDSSALFETETGAILGTPAYMAPEQALGKDCIDPRVDVYGLGAVLYECLTGRPPFRAATPLETLYQARTLEPSPPRQLEPGVPRDLETICLRCLEKDPARRYATADALANDLGRFLRGEPVLARPVGWSRRAWKWVCRRPTAASLLTMSGVVFAALAAVIAAYTVRLRIEVDRANANAEEKTRHRDRAASNYLAARSALRQMLGRLADQKAGEIPHLKELQRDQLEYALAFYERTLGGLDEPDLEIQLDAALALVEVGVIRHQLGREDAARTDLLRASEVLERVPSEYRARTESRTTLSTCYTHLANLTTHRVEAEAYLQKALVEVEELVRAHPFEPVGHNRVARAENNLALFFGSTDPAEAHHLKAIEIRRSLIARQPQVEVYRAELGENLVNLGLLYWQTNRPDPAGESFRNAESLLLPLVQAHPADDRYGLSLAGVFINWGNLLRFGGDLPGSIAKFDRAVELADAAIRREPLYVTARLRALESHGARALALVSAKRPADALPDWDRVIEYTTGSDRLRYRACRAAALASAGWHSRAATEAHDLAGKAGLTDDDRYNLTCCLALAVEPARTDPLLGGLVAAAAAEGNAAAAMRLLRLLQDAGYFRTSHRAKLLTEDADLISLRNRSDFRKLLADVAGGLNP